MRIIFMGTPDFAAKALAALIPHHTVVAVYCQPPRPAGRGHHLRPSPVQAFAESHSLEVRHPKSLRPSEVQQAFKDLQADIAVVAAYGLILPQAILDMPRLGCLNIHGSLLPRWRGAAPIQRAIEAGDRETGITIMQMDAGLDTGAMLLKKVLPIGSTDTSLSLYDTLAEVGAAAIVEALAGLEAGKLSPEPQSEDGVTYASKLDKSESLLDWTQSAEVLERRVRAFNPWPSTTCTLPDGQVLKVLEAEVIAIHTPLAAGIVGGIMGGTIIDSPLVVACGEGSALSLTKVQRAGKGAVSAVEFIRGYGGFADSPIGGVLM